jgi:hypothetical protein
MISELIMLLCFGASWPVSIYKSYKAKTAKGKSIFFLLLIFIGYLAGIIYKIFYHFDFVIYFYILNCLMVFTDILICKKNIEIDKKNENI